MKNIYQSIIAAMEDAGSIAKTRSGEGIRYNFRGIEDVLSKFQPILIKHKMFCAPRVVKEIHETFPNKSGTTTFRVTLNIDHTFYAEDGSSIVVTTAGEGIDSSDKASNKAMSAAFKYAFFELFCIPTDAADDSDYQNPTVTFDNYDKKKEVNYGSRSKNEL